MVLSGVGVGFKLFDELSVCYVVVVGFVVCVVDVEEVYWVFIWLVDSVGLEWL